MVEGYIQLGPRGLWGIKARQINISLFAPFQAYPGTNQAYWWEFWKSEVHPEEANSLLGKSKSCEYKYIFPHQFQWKNNVSAERDLTIKGHWQDYRYIQWKKIGK